MKRNWIILAAIVGVVAVAMVFTAALGVVGFLVARGAVSSQKLADVAYAQASTPVSPVPSNSSQGNYQGMMGGRRGRTGGYGMMGGGMMTNGSYGPMHTYMVQSLADQLGLKVEDVQSRIQAGETPYQIAQSQGKTDNEIKTLMQTAHDEALKSAVAAGVITQAQADWMDQHMEQMWQNGGTGGCPGGMWGNPQATQPAK